MTVKERASCINTIKLLQRLAFNVHGVMDVIDAENCDKIIKMLEADAQQWIPCSERLPEDYTDVLAWFEYFRYGNYNCLYQTYGIGSYSMEYDSWMINHETGWHKLRVIAWMPLPEPWKGEQNE